MKLAQLAQTRIDICRQSQFNHNELNEIKEYILNWASKGHQEWLFYNDLTPYITILENEGFNIEVLMDNDKQFYKLTIK